MQVNILTESFNPWQELTAYAAQVPNITRYGALNVFVGSLRDFNQGDIVESMQLEYYPEMTTKVLKEIAQQALDQYDIGDVLLLHRVGCVVPAEPIVLVAVWSAHRKDAYAANQSVMEDLKQRAPFWKKEKLVDKERWVSNLPN